jgi:hypothetical protein
MTYNPFSAVDSNTGAHAAIFDPFSILPDKPAGMPAPAVAVAAAPAVQIVPEIIPAIIPPSIINSGYNGNNMPVATEDEIEKALTTRRTGRMSTFTLARVITVIETVEDGGTMKEAAAAIGVDRKTIWAWMQLSPGFGNAVARARECQGHASADDAVNILDDVDITGTDAKQNMAALRKAEQRARIRMQLAECFNFNQYGKKKQNMNVNVNATIRPVDLSRFC